jgi:DNA-binding response OmpR family regulator
MQDEEQKTIFIVDDDEAILDSMKLILEGEGFRIQTAIDSKALEKNLQTKLPNLFILDYRLPGQTGTEIARNLKANAETKHIPIIMVSSHDVRPLAQNAGVSDFFEKPFDIETLLSVVNKHLPS